MCTSENKHKDKKTLTLNTVKYNRPHKRLLILVYAKHQVLFSPQNTPPYPKISHVMTLPIASY